jgi:hypothetical protein
VVQWRVAYGTAALSSFASVAQFRKLHAACQCATAIAKFFGDDICVAYSLNQLIDAFGRCQVCSETPWQGENEYRDCCLLILSSLALSIVV